MTRTDVYVVVGLVMLGSGSLMNSSPTTLGGVLVFVTMPETLTSTSADADVSVGLGLSARTVPLPTTPGLPDEAYEHDGQLTKREVRAATLAALGPTPDKLLWDVGAGSGSVGIEWMLADRSLRAVAIEADAARAMRIARNAAALGVAQTEQVLNLVRRLADRLDPACRPAHARA